MDKKVIAENLRTESWQKWNESVPDLNESPICPTNNVAETIGLLAPVGEIIYELNCYDTDRDENNKNISYTISTASGKCYH
jgi:hypothetical protein